MALLEEIDAFARPLSKIRVRPRVQRSGRVLVAEDDAAMRRLLCETLLRAGHEVLAVSDGCGLLDAVGAALVGDGVMPDVIVTDVRMPGVSPLEVLEGLRSTDAWIPAIVITAFGDDALHARVEALGARCLDKPFDLDHLRGLVAVRVAVARACDRVADGEPLPW